MIPRRELVDRLFTQIFRNRIVRSRELQNKIRRIESAIRANYHRNEPDIVSEIVREWNLNSIIDLQPLILNGISHHLWLEFTQAFTHGKPYVTVDIELDEKEWIEKIEYETEFGDLALIVEYYLEYTLLSSRLNLLQTKKETQQDQTEISLHQLYLMQFWPSVRFGNQTFKFNNIAPEDFSFYHFILSKSKPADCSSTICSSPLVYATLGLAKSSLVNQLRIWDSQRKSSSAKPKAPALTFNGLLPGAVDGVNIRGRNDWSMVPKPFSRFLSEAAYLFVGTPNEEIRKLAELRVPNILYLKARASRERRQE